MAHREIPQKNNIFPSSVAFILAAGKGTRMHADLPKGAHVILGRPLVVWAIRAAQQAGFERIVVVIGTGEQTMREILKDEAVEIVVQHEQKGTGHAVAVALDAIQEVPGAAFTQQAEDVPVAVFYGDTPLVRASTLRSLANAVTEAPDVSAALLTMEPCDPSGYGRVVAAKDGQIETIIEDKDCTPEEREALRQCNSGMYVFRAGALAKNIKKLSAANAQGEYYITDMVKILRDQRCVVKGVKAQDEEELLGVNSQKELAEAAKIMQRRINDEWMAQGVGMLDPALVWIEPTVVLEKNTMLLPMTFLRGKTSVHQYAQIGPNCRLTDTVVGEHATVDETVADSCVIEEEVTVGPRAYLRAGTHLKRGAHAGTHIEIKNSVVGEGSKVPHLSYIGDTTIGSNTNIGAGSITCNYDGFKKHKTSIGDNTFIGSNTMMVAPVAIGNDVITGAGSTITQDVEDGALGLARAKQTNKAGYTRAYRAMHGDHGDQGGQGGKNDQPDESGKPGQSRQDAKK